MEGLTKGGNLQELVKGFGSRAIEHAFATSTTAAQKSSLKAWKRFCKMWNVTWELRDLSFEDTVAIVLAFIGFEVGVREMNPKSIKGVYLGAIANIFVMQGIKNQFGEAVKSAIVKISLRGYIRIYHLMNPVAGEKKFAFTIELVKYLGAALRKFKPQWNCIELERPLTIALEFGIYFLLRKSEYLPCGTNSGGIKWKNIVFFDKDGKQCPFINLTRKVARSVQINITHSKMDQHGYGRLLKHNAVDGDVCIVKKLVDWAIRCRDKYNMSADDFLFKKRKCVAMVNDGAVSLAMKCIVRFLGWNTKKVSPHSLRYGGATMLAAAGLPQYVIAYFGGWSNDSKSLRIYAQVGSEAVTQVSKIMAMGYGISLEESRIRAYANSL